MKSYNEKKWERKEDCNCWKCRENEEVHEKIVINVDCNKEHDRDNQKNDYDKKDQDKKDHEKKHDSNKWIREILEKNFLYKEVTFFTKDSTHTEGIVSEVGKEFVKLVRGNEPIEVESNCENDEELEEFDLYFIRLDCICGFGRETED